MGILRKIVIDEISGVRKPANKHARVLLLKSLDEAKYDVDAGEAMQKALDDGLLDGMTKDDLDGLIKVRADEIKKPGERKEAAYARAVSEDPMAMVVHSAVKRAMGPTQLQPPSSARRRKSPRPAPQLRGPRSPGRELAWTRMSKCLYRMPEWTRETRKRS